MNIHAIDLDEHPLLAREFTAFSRSEPEVICVAHVSANSRRQFEISRQNGEWQVRQFCADGRSASLKRVDADYLRTLVNSMPTLERDGVAFADVLDGEAYLFQWQDVKGIHRLMIGNPDLHQDEQIRQFAALLKAIFDSRRHPFAWWSR